MVYIIIIAIVFAIIIFACYSEASYIISSLQQNIQSLADDYEAVIEGLSKDVEKLEHEVETLKKQLNK